MIWLIGGALSHHFRKSFTLCTSQKLSLHLNQLRLYLCFQYVQLNPKSAKALYHGLHLITTRDVWVEFIDIFFSCRLHRDRRNFIELKLLLI